MKTEIIIIGDEILLGLIRDTNSVYLTRYLAEYGIPVRRITKVGDTLDAIAEAFESACMRSELVISCGGLGPTHDDKTRHAVAAFLHSPLEMNEPAMDEILAMYKRMNWTMSESNRIQGMIPKDAGYLSNTLGTAPGIRFRHLHAEGFVLQGIPREMEAMVDKHIRPFLENLGFVKTTLHRTLRTTNVPESVLFEQTKDLIVHYESLFDVAFLPKITRGVDIRLTLKKSIPAVTQTDGFEEPLNLWKERVNERFDNAVFGMDDDTIEETVARLLLKAGMTVATAESCTGGMLANRLTNIPGSSGYFMRGVVAYSNQSKCELLGVPEELIRDYGAVSGEVAMAMAEGVRKSSGTDIGLATTGIAGPTGGTETKPVGLVYIGLCIGDKTTVHQPFKTLVPLDRLSFKERTVQFALDVLRKNLLTK